MIGSWEHSHPPDAIIVEIIVYRNCILVDSSMSHYLVFSLVICILLHSSMGNKSISHSLISRTYVKDVRDTKASIYLNRLNVSAVPPATHSDVREKLRIESRIAARAGQCN
jgi:hypothetical protein